MGSKTFSNGVRILVNHDYISLTLGNGRTLTASRNGEKSRGDIPNGVFDSFSNVCWTSKVPLAEGLEAWAINVLPTVWPEWNKVPVEPTIGMKIEQDNGKGRAAWRGIHQGEVIKLAKRKGGLHSVQFTYGVAAMTSGEIGECKVVL